MIKSSKLYYVRNHQKQLSDVIYNNHTKALLRGKNNPSTMGKRIVLPSSFNGGTYYKFHNYQDVMTIGSWVGYSDLFITFTYNQKWPEISRTIERHGLKSVD